jgi:hypothetical protein
MSWYGIDLQNYAADLDIVKLPQTHRILGLLSSRTVEIPVELDPAFDLNKTCHLTRLIVEWGVAPLAFLQTLKQDSFSYAYVGREDYTMYPLIQPGAFLRIDETQNTVATGPWRTEVERPVYLVETRAGFFCAWCELRHDELILHSHPTSRVATRIFPHPQDAEVIGRVVGVATHFGASRERAVAAIKDPLPWKDVAGRSC